MQLTVTPKDGGALVTRVSSAEAGAPRYTQKVNWRRDLSDEVTREGWCYFNPIPGADDYQTFPFPSPAVEPITLIHHVRRPNGDSAIVAGTKTTLYRFNQVMAGYVSGNYADGVYDGPGNSLQPYFATPTRWQIIGSGFSPNGKRWETADDNGSTIFSNGVDLPVEFRTEYWDTQPLYELREQGVLSCGTITESNSLMVGGDITEIAAEDVGTVLDVVSSGAVTLSQYGFRRSHTISATSISGAVVSSAAFFVSGDVGRVIVWSNGIRQTITSFTDSTHVSVGGSGSITAARSFWVTDDFQLGSRPAFEIHASADFFTSDMVGGLIAWASGDVRKIVQVVSPTVAITDQDRYVRFGSVTMDNPKAFMKTAPLKASILSGRVTELQTEEWQFRLLWSETSQPARFAMQLSCTIVANSRVLTLTRTTRSFSVGDVVTVVGAGVDGGALKTSIIGIGPGVIIIKDQALTGGDGTLIRTSAIGGTAGYYDLQDEGAPILKISSLREQMVVYKDGNIFLGAYTGISANPFNFTRIVVPHERSLFFRHTLVTVGGTAHFYAGRNRFYMFDLVTRTPQPVESADAMSNLFYDAANIADTELIYASDNGPTQEIWITCPSASATTICFDHIYKTFSTIDFAFSAAASVKDLSQSLAQETSNWFLAGTTDGTLVQYGLSDKPVALWDGEKAIWYRQQMRPYSDDLETPKCVLSSGRIHFGDAFNEKQVTGYDLQFSSTHEDGQVAVVSFYSSLNQNSPEFLIGSAAISNDDRRGLVPLWSVTHYIRDEIVSEAQVQVRLHTRTWDFDVVNSKSYTRK